jgi:hypothetical protein
MTKRLWGPISSSTRSCGELIVMVETAEEGRATSTNPLAVIAVERIE